MQKVHTKQLADGSHVHTLRTLLDHLSGIVRNTCRCRDTQSDTTFTMVTTPNRTQQMALDLLQTISV